MQLDAVLVAAGASTRFREGDKLFAELDGRPLLAWSLAALAGAACVDRVVVVTSAANLERAQEVAAHMLGPRLVAIVQGGARRRDSVEAGLRACRSRYVAIHDGARPLCSSGLIDRVAAAAERSPGAIAALPVVETIKEVRDGRAWAHPDRSALWAAQTPQVVLRQAWVDAAAAGDDDETDDAAMLSRLGLECTVVEGEVTNIKVTRPIDLDVARLILSQRSRP